MNQLKKALSLTGIFLILLASPGWASKKNFLAYIEELNTFMLNLNNTAAFQSKIIDKCRKEGVTSSLLTQYARSIVEMKKAQLQFEKKTAALVDQDIVHLRSLDMRFTSLYIETAGDIKAILWTAKGKALDYRQIQTINRRFESRLNEIQEQIAKESSRLHKNYGMDVKKSWHILDNKIWIALGVLIIAVALFCLFRG
jgi:hypothetical protein